MLIENGADVNVRDRFTNSALTTALEKGSENIAELLILNGADLTVVTKYGSTPLLLAITNGNESVFLNTLIFIEFTHTRY